MTNPNEETLSSPYIMTLSYLTEQRYKEGWESVGRIYRSPDPDNTERELYCRNIRRKAPKVVGKPMLSFELKAKELGTALSDKRNPHKSVYVVHSLLKGGAIGVIKWFTLLNSYCFFPVRGKKIILNAKCCEEIRDHIEGIS
jgi:hypothetical protein